MPFFMAQRKGGEYLCPRCNHWYKAQMSAYRELGNIDYDAYWREHGGRPEGCTHAHLPGTCCHEKETLV